MGHGEGGYRTRFSLAGRGSDGYAAGACVLGLDPTSPPTGSRRARDSGRSPRSGRAEPNSAHSSGCRGAQIHSTSSFASEDETGTHLFLRVV